MNSNTSITAAYWKEPSYSNEYVSTQNCTIYTRLKARQVIKGFKILQTEISQNKIFPKHIIIYHTNSDNDAWTIIYSNTNIEKKHSIEILFKKPILTKYLKAELIKHHGPGNKHDELTSTEENVPFNSLDNFFWITEDNVQLELLTYDENYFQNPTAPPTIYFDSKLPDKVSYELKSNEVVFSNCFTTLSFSLFRPVMRIFEVFRQSNKKSSKNLLYSHSVGNFGMISGPRISAINTEIPANFCSANVSINNNKIFYKNVSPVQGLKWDYCFEIESNHILITIDQTVTENFHFIECEPWRWCWNLKESIAANLGLPVQKGKNGRCQFPTAIHFPKQGTIVLELIQGDSKSNFIKTDSWRNQGIGMTGIECGIHLNKDGEIVPILGKTSLKIKISQLELGLLTKNDNMEKMHPSFIEVWPNVFGFRPEYFGMSNNSASLNCHFVQHVYAEMAHYTKAINANLSMMKLCGYSLEMSLNGGMGYGSNRNFYLDSDASVLIGSGIYIKSTKDIEWANRNWFQIQICINRLLNSTDNKGLIVSKSLTGNSGEYNWSSNWWDVISFGYLDAYSNALAYRAFKFTSYIAKIIGKQEESKLYLLAAQKIKSAYYECFYNSSTGWLAGWKSKDGKIHDYAFLFVNGIAITYGLVPKENIVPIIEKLEDKRKSVGYNHFHLGLPGNLIPIPKSDYARNVLGSGEREDGSDSYGIYENGGATMSQSYYYLRALEIAKMPIVREIENAFLKSFITGEVFGGLGSGCDWKSWDGLSVGYEGMLSDQFYVLLAIAKNRGFIESLDF